MLITINYRWKIVVGLSATIVERSFTEIYSFDRLEKS
jgi:hypothetical protein